MTTIERIAEEADNHFFATDWHFVRFVIERLKMPTEAITEIPAFSP